MKIGLQITIENTWEMVEKVNVTLNKILQKHTYYDVPRRQLQLGSKLVSQLPISMQSFQKRWCDLM